MMQERQSLNILITAGPTREFIDPVRFISNASTGTIGYLIAQNARRRKHNVILLSGPTNLKASRDINVAYFCSALELKKQVDMNFPWADCVIFSSAVGDFRPKKKSKKKIKKNMMLSRLTLIKNPDILKRLGKKKKNKVLIGFALETENLQKNARAKLKEKNLDLIIANLLSADNIPFGDNQISAMIIGHETEEKFVNIKKDKLAGIILDRAEKLCYSLKK